ncbi:OmpH family outer membrane protein [Flavimarina sp. Hel_I_48]|uniref:OmpH family outer membrane protein n=1 Tax=Flavimarina sp. Hel_I_48 TaxID=1392488 RepID=UPI0004DEE38E|nr:OmpH family outer membrane protein [Flavimarina sp. Hel_I_48]
MKQMKTLVLAIALILGMNGIAQAQDSKIAHIATQELLEQMPAFKSAQGEMQKIQSSYEAEMQTMGQELQKTMERYSREAETKTDEENMSRQQEVEQTRNKIVEYRQTAMQDMQKKESDLLKPVYEKARTTIQKIARDKGYNYVLDSTTGTGLLLADGYDLMPDVKKALGI